MIGMRQRYTADLLRQQHLTNSKDRNPRLDSESRFQVVMSLVPRAQSTNDKGGKSLEELHERLDGLFE